MAQKWELKHRVINKFKRGSTREPTNYHNSSKSLDAVRTRDNYSIKKP